MDSASDMSDHGLVCIALCANMQQCMCSKCTSKQLPAGSNIVCESGPEE
jgi:hypothetical protein